MITEYGLADGCSPVWGHRMISFYGIPQGLPLFAGNMVQYSLLPTQPELTDTLVWTMDMTQMVDAMNDLTGTSAFDLVNPFLEALGADNIMVMFSRSGYHEGGFEELPENENSDYLVFRKTDDASGWGGANIPFYSPDLADRTFGSLGFFDAGLTVYTGIEAGKDCDGNALCQFMMNLMEDKGISKIGLQVNMQGFDFNEGVQLAFEAGIEGEFPIGDKFMFTSITLQLALGMQ